MTATERIAELRQAHREMCAALTDLGLPPDLIFDDARAGIEQCERRRARAGR